MTSAVVLLVLVCSLVLATLSRLVDLLQCLLVSWPLVNYSLQGLWCNS